MAATHARAVPVALQRTGVARCTPTTTRSTSMPTVRVPVLKFSMYVYTAILVCSTSARARAIIGQMRDCARAVHARALSHHAACLSPYARRVRRMAQQSGSRRSIGDAPPTLALDVVIRIAINAPIRVRRRAQLAAHVHCALASHLVARCLSSAARCSSRMFARAYSLCTPRHTLTGSGCHLPHVLAGSARAEARWRARRAARGHAALHVPISNEIVRL